MPQRFGYRRSRGGKKSYKRGGFKKGGYRKKKRPSGKKMMKRVNNSRGGIRL